MTAPRHEVVALALFAVVAWMTVLPSQANGPKSADSHHQHGHAPGAPAHGHQHEGGPSGGHDDGAHIHAPVPPEYQRAHVPAFVWTNAAMIARGKEIYTMRCAVCHGDTGDGKGPAGFALPLKPPDLRDTTMVGEMAGNYWFWRVSEGGLVEPFKSAGSTMPAWKDDLSVEDRWAVIAYQHTFSEHVGPHVTSEHPQLAAPSATHVPSPGAGPAAASAPPPTGTGGHKH
jgi:mono/diheme cytochrome c family protein